MKKNPFIIFLFVFSVNCCGQVTFQKTLGGINTDYGQSIQQTTDKGYIVAGYTGWGTGNTDIYLVKTDSSGNLLWTKTYGGTSEDYGEAVRQTADGGYIIAGSTNSFGAGSYDIYVIKTDSSGNTLWTKAFGGIDYDRGYSIQQTSDGGYIIVGYAYSFGAGAGVYLIKTNNNGDTLWTKTFSSYGFGKSVYQTSDGGYIITGGYGQAFLIKTDSNGNAIWSKFYGTSSTCEGNSVEQTTDGGYIIIGLTGDFMVNAMDVYIIKTDSSGNVIWSKTFGGTSNDKGNSVQQTTDGGYIFSGFTGSFGAGFNDAFLIKTDDSGNALWEKTFGGPGNDNGLSVQQTTDGGYVLTGWNSSFGAGGYDFNFIKTDSNGNSGCNEGNFSTIIPTPSTQVTNFPTISNSTSTVLTTTNAIVGTGGSVTILCASVGINEITIDSSFLIFPNPSSGIFVISFEETIMKGNVEILNTIGERVFTENIFNELQKEIKVENLSQGIYFVKVFDGEKSYCKKLIVD